jgi:hypothetical protein
MDPIDLFLFVVSPFVDVSDLTNKETPTFIKVCAWISIVCTIIIISYSLWYGISPLVVK